MFSFYSLLFLVIIGGKLLRFRSVILRISFLWLGLERLSTLVQLGGLATLTIETVGLYYYSKLAGRAFNARVTYLCKSTEQIGRDHVKHSHYSKSGALATDAAIRLRTFRTGQFRYVV